MAEKAHMDVSSCFTMAALENMIKTCTTDVGTSLTFGMCQDEQAWPELLRSLSMRKEDTRLMRRYG